MAHATFASAHIIKDIEQAIHNIPIAMKKAMEQDNEDLKEFVYIYCTPYRQWEVKRHEATLKRILLLAKANHSIALTDEDYALIERYVK